MLYMVETELAREYLTVQQAAKYLGVSAQTLRRWDADGKLKSVRHPSNDYRYYKKSDLEPLRLEYKRAEQVNPGKFFQSTAADIENNERLREPQREAHKAVREHFAASRASAIIQIPALKEETYGRDFAEMLQDRRTFDEALADSALTIMTRQRLKIVKNQLFARLQDAPVL